MAASPGGVEVGRISVRVVPDTSRLGADLKVALDRIEAQTDLKVSTSIDTTLLDAQAKAAVEQAQTAAGNIHIKTEVDTSQVREAESALGGASGAASAFSSGLGGIATAAIVLGPALIPLVAIVAALGTALLAPLAITAGGLTIFGFLAGFAVSTTQKQLKQIQTLKTSLSGLTKGTAAYNQKAKELHAAQAALTPGQKAFGTALNALKGVFHSVPLDIVLKPVTAALNLLAKVLPILTPVVKAASGALSSMLGDLSKAAGSQGFKDFVHAFAHQLGPDIKAFATIAGNVFKGLTGLFFAFSDTLSGSVLKSLVNLTKKFANWGQTLGQSKGFKSFVQYVKDVGPKVAAALGAIAGAAVAIVTAFAPIGGVVLQAITDVAGAISKIPTDTLTTLAGAVVALVAGMKLLGPLQGIITGIIAAPEVALVVALVGGLTLGFIALYRHSKPVRQILGDLWSFFKTQLLPIIKNAAEKVVPALKSAFHDVSKTVRDNYGFLKVFGELLLVLGSATVVTGILALVGVIRGIGLAFKVTVKALHFLADAFLLSFEFILRGAATFFGFLLTGFGTIIHSAALAFGWIPGLGGKLKGADASFQSFTASVVDNLRGAASNVAAFRQTLDAALAPPRPIKITVDDLRAVQQLEALQAFRLKDKTLTVTTNFIERVVGPGGGIGQPSKNNANGIPAPVVPPAHGDQPGVRSGSGRGDTYNIQAQDYNAFLRQLQSRKRGKAGGGVDLTPAGAR